MLTGEYQHTLDQKGRIIIPSKLRCEFGNDIIITRGLDGCLFGFDQATFRGIVDKLNSLPFTRSDVRNFTRFFTSGAITLEFDKQGRINLPTYLCDHANLEDDVVIVGVINRLEIWSLSRWTEFMAKNVDSLSDISENLFDSSLGL